VHGPDHEAIRRRAIEERYRLLPYIYTVAEEASRDGVPMMRPMFLEFPDAGGAWTLDHAAPAQFMWGPDLLVAPPPHGESPAPYQVLLPPGDWFDFQTGLRVGAEARNAVVSIEGRAQAGGDGSSGLRVLSVTPAEVLPVFVRAGSIIPRHGVIQSTGEVPQGPLALHVYPGPDCRGSLYLDDGTSPAYRAGHFLRCDLRCEDTVEGLTVRQARSEGPFQPWWQEIEIILHDVDEPDEPDEPERWRYDPALRVARTIVAQAMLGSGVAWKQRRQADKGDGPGAAPEPAGA
jgi:alpha-glucosidase